MLIKQLIDLKKVRTENLKFRTDLQDQVMDGLGSTVNDCLQRQIAKKKFKSKIKACPVNTGHCLAFNSFVTYSAANFGCYQIRIMPDIVSKLLHAAI